VGRRWGSILSPQRGQVPRGVAEEGVEGEGGADNIPSHSDA